MHVFHMQILIVFFFNDPTTPEIYTLSLHDALPIFPGRAWRAASRPGSCPRATKCSWKRSRRRSEEHTSKLQSQFHLVCRLLLEKKKPLTIMPLATLSAYAKPVQAAIRSNAIACLFP